MTESIYSITATGTVSTMGTGVTWALWFDCMFEEFDRLE